MPSDKVTIAISGYYGFDNAGDEAVLAGILESIRDQDSSIKCVVLSGAPQRTKNEHAVEAVQRMSMKSVWDTLRSSHLLISGGGSLLQDTTSSRTVPYYAGIVHMAALANTPAIMYAQGVGPLTTGIGRMVTSSLKNKVLGVSVRDEDSAHLLMQLGFDKDHIRVSADPVFGLSPAPQPDAHNLLGREGLMWGKGVVGVSVRQTNGQRNYFDAVSSLVRWITSTGRRAVLIPFHHPDDLRVCDIIAENSGLDGVGILRQVLTPRQLLRVLGEFEMVVGTRLHSLIFAGRMGTPFVGLSYDPKVASFCNRMGMRCHDVGSVTDEMLISSVKLSLGESNDLREHLRRLYPVLRTAVDEDARWAIQVARDEADRRHDKERRA